ncbi:MAG: DMT family transporter [Eggerthellaceae bacterium]|nr:DMT family transporter [Eggerthellaceae bacterium]
MERMRVHREIPPAGYRLMLVLAPVIWGLSFVIMKDSVQVIPPAQLIGVRFLCAGVLLGAVFFKRVRAAFCRDMLVRGAILGTLLFLAFWFQTIGVANTTPGKNAFLTATYVVLVPFGWWIIARRRPGIHNLVAAVLCLAGIGFVSLDSDLTAGYGDLMTLVGAVWFAVHMIYVAKFSEGRDMVVLTVYQFFAMGIWGTLIGLVIEPLPALSSITGGFIGEMVYLIVFASCAALLFQNVAQAHVPPAQASLLLSLEAVFGVLFSVLIYGELISIRLIVGFVLVFVAIVVSEVFPEIKKPLIEK